MRTTRAAARAEGVIFDEVAMTTPSKTVHTPVLRSGRKPLGEIFDNPKQPTEEELTVSGAGRKELESAGKRSTRKKAPTTKLDEAVTEETESQTDTPIPEIPTACESIFNARDFKMIPHPEVGRGAPDTTSELLEHSIEVHQPSSEEFMSEPTTHYGLSDCTDIEDESGAMDTQERIMMNQHHEPEEKTSQAYDEVVLDQSSALAALISIATLHEGITEAEQQLKEIFNAEVVTDAQHPPVLSAEVQPTNTKKRLTIAALNTPPPLTKSQKPLTKSTFHLQSDEVAARLKLQRDERMKRREQAEAQKALEAKSKPILRNIKVAEVKTTVASRARMSLMAESKLLESDTGPKRLSTITKSRLSTMPRTSVSRPALRESLGENSIGAGGASSKSRVRQSIHRMPPKLSGSMNSAPARISTASVGQRPLAKDIFDRGRVDPQEQQKSIREKADALKKARAEAAERGRQASQAWAAKRKNATVGSKSANTGSKENSKPVV